MLQKIILIFISIFVLQSCVPYKNIVYVQGDLPDNQIDSAQYKIQKHDILYISIKSANENIERLFNIQQTGNLNNIASPQSLYFNGYSVDDKGFIELPVIGKLAVEAKTFEEVKQLIKKGLLKTQFTNLDDIFIKVKLAGVPYTIIGEVKTPQTGILYKNKPTIFDVLGDAKDITLVGDRKEVVIIRKEQNRQVKSRLDLTSPEIVTSPFFYIRPYDIIYVKPLPQKVWGTGATLQQTISTTITTISLITTIILLTRLN